MKVWTVQLPSPKTQKIQTFLQVWICLRSIWQGLLSLNGTLEEWVKRSDAEFAATEAEIREIRELLDE